MSIRYDDSNLEQLFNKNELEIFQQKTIKSLELLKNRSGAGSEFLGWLDLPNQNVEELQKLIEVGNEIKNSNDLLVCIGIGGSYLGAKAVISSLKPKNNIRFIGHHLSPLELSNLLVELEERDFYVNVISKSGTTTEPGIAFRIIRELVEKKYGEDSKNRIIATTDKKAGALKKLADNNGYRTFVIPDDVGGRFSVLTPVGLLPIVSAGLDLKMILKGAKRGLENSLESDEKNIAFRYAMNRSILYSQEKKIEILASMEPQINFIAEWWKQLYGESEGKNGNGIFPASVNFTTDLHSLGQMIQDGERNLFETFLVIENYSADIKIPFDKENLDGLNYLSGRSLSFVNSKAYDGTVKAHRDGGVPISTFYIDELDEENIMELLVIFEIGVALSAYNLGVNPFDQPGVVAYKNNMFELLGKPNL
ncbi:MAG: glucose-6-phosphate isomerase [Candidatus Marinimicrobia bacterium]|nr:glucose-6-phosphate isomerase [Candidatus Neomarinimicrobiota bacterium]